MTTASHVTRQPIRVFEHGIIDHPGRNYQLFIGKLWVRSRTVPPRAAFHHHGPMKLPSITPSEHKLLQYWQPGPLRGRHLANKVEYVDCDKSAEKCP